MNPEANALFPVDLSNHGFHPDFDFDFLQVDIEDMDSNPSAAFSQWELVNPSDADDSDDPSDFDYDCYDDRDVTSGPVVALEFSSLVEDSSVGNSPPLIDLFICGDAYPDLPTPEAEIADSIFEGNAGMVGDGFEYHDDYDYDYDYDEDDEDEEEYDDGLDDELVPRHMRGKLGRERIRKLGKRGCSKMNTSKKSPFLYVRPGCLHGKHGFGIGLKNSL